jgi:hypothetical protein
MSRNRLTLLLLALALFSPVLLSVAGCNTGKDTGTMVQYDPEKSKKMDEKSLEAVKNNPNIPESQKQAIMARMQSRNSVR